VSDSRELEAPPSSWGARILRRLAPGAYAARRRAELEVRQADFAHRTWGEVERSFGRGGFQGASKEHGSSAWSPGGSDADGDLLDDLPALRERTRDLARNDPQVGGLLEGWVDGILGTGLVPQPDLDLDELQITREEARRYARAIHHIVMRRFWPRVDSANLLTFGEFQALTLYSVFENGEALYVMRPQAERKPYSTRVACYEPDQLMDPTDWSGPPYLMRDGVELSDAGEHVAYHIRRAHPGNVQAGELAQQSVRVPAVDGSGRPLVVHAYRHRRIGQSRGIPRLHAAVRTFRNLQQYVDAELVGAKVAAAFALFITTQDPQGMAAAAAAASNRTGKREEFIKPGSIRYLGPGEKVETGNPGRANPNFKAFLEAGQRVGYGAVRMPYEVASCDFSKTTYTSGRMALILCQAGYQIWQNWVGLDICQPIYERLLEEAFLLGELRVPKFLERFHAWTRARWQGPARPYVDPEKEIGASVTAIENCLGTIADECAARNQYWEDVLEQRALEEARKRELKIPAAAPKGTPPGAPPGSAQDGEDQPQPEEVPSAEA